MKPIVLEKIEHVSVSKVSLNHSSFSDKGCSTCTETVLAMIKVVSATRTVAVSLTPMTENQCRNE